MSETTPLSPGLCASGLLLDGPGTAARLPWNALADEIALVLRDPGVRGLFPE